VPAIVFEVEFQFEAFAHHAGKKHAHRVRLCQSVAFIIAAIVAPAGDCSTAMARDCFDPTPATIFCCDG
jgi:hypothetical protein